MALQNEGEKTKKKKGMAIGCLSIVVILVVVAMLIRDKKDQTAALEKDSSPGSASKVTDSTSPPSESSAPKKDEPPKPDFVQAREEACEKYKEAKNEIQKSELFSSYMEGAKRNKLTVDDMLGEVDEIDTPHGGGSVILKIKTRFGTFGNNDILQGNKRDIKKRNPLYKAIGSLSEGDKAKFSGTMLEPFHNPISEQASVCGDDWIVKFTKVVRADR